MSWCKDGNGTLMQGMREWGGSCVPLLGQGLQQDTSMV